MTDLTQIQSEIKRAETAEQNALTQINQRRSNLPVIDVVNESSVVSDTDCKRYVDAVQIQVERDFFPHWGLSAVLNFIPRGGKPDPAYWWMAVVDDSTQANALGYHYTSNTGQPLGIVAARTDLQNGSSVSVTISHEIGEMIADPRINLAAQLDDTRFAALEPFDPTESDSDGYLIGDVLVSNFALPAYYDPDHPGPYDFRGLLTSGMPALRPDGYLSIFVPGQGWTQINASTSPKMKMRAIPHIGSRRQRRVTPRSEWVRSVLTL